jgi:hypothetical protein
MRGRSAPGRDVEGLKRDLGQAEIPVEQTGGNL